MVAFLTLQSDGSDGELFFYYSRNRASNYRLPFELWCAYHHSRNQGCVLHLLLGTVILVISSQKPSNKKTCMASIAWQLIETIKNYQTKCWSHPHCSVEWSFSVKSEEKTVTCFFWLKTHMHLWYKPGKCVMTYGRVALCRNYLKPCLSRYYMYWNNAWLIIV